LPQRPCTGLHWGLRQRTSVVRHPLSEIALFLPPDVPAGETVQVGGPERPAVLALHSITIPAFEAARDYYAAYTWCINKVGCTGAETHEVEEDGAPVLSDVFIDHGKNIISITAVHRHVVNFFWNAGFVVPS